MLVFLSTLSAVLEKCCFHKLRTRTFVTTTMLCRKRTTDQFAKIFQKIYLQLKRWQWTEMYENGPCAVSFTVSQMTNPLLGNLKQRLQLTGKTETRTEYGGRLQHPVADPVQRRRRKQARRRRIAELCTGVGAALRCGAAQFRTERTETARRVGGSRRQPVPGKMFAERCRRFSRITSGGIHSSSPALSLRMFVWRVIAGLAFARARNLGYCRRCSRSHLVTVHSTHLWLGTGFF